MSSRIDLQDQDVTALILWSLRLNRPCVDECEGKSWIFGKGKRKMSFPKPFPTATEKALGRATSFSNGAVVGSPAVGSASTQHCGISWAACEPHRLGHDGPSGLPEHCTHRACSDQSPWGHAGLAVLILWRVLRKAW